MKYLYILINTLFKWLFNTWLFEIYFYLRNGWYQLLCFIICWSFLANLSHAFMRIKHRIRVRSRGNVLLWYSRLEVVSDLFISEASPDRKILACNTRPPVPVCPRGLIDQNCPLFSHHSSKHKPVSRKEHIRLSVDWKYTSADKFHSRR